MIIDGHVHHREGADAGAFAAKMRSLGMRCCLIGDTRPSAWELGTNESVAAVLRAHPDVFYGVASLGLGRGASPDAVRQWRDRGFVGLKFIGPTTFYDDERFFPVYAQAEAEKMFCLFHTGVVGPGAHQKGLRISSRFMDPTCLDMIAREFPDLRIVMAHLGVPHYDVGAFLIRIHPNLYADLAGSGIWGYIGSERLRSLLDLRREGLSQSVKYDKLVFGSDSYADRPEMPEKALRGYEKFFDELQLPTATRRQILGETLASWIHPT